MKNNLRFILGGLILCSPIIAYAQEFKPTGLSVRFGQFQPSNQVARKEGSNWFAGGIEFKLKDLNAGLVDRVVKNSLSVSVDHYSSGDLGATPLLFNFTGRRNATYYSAGAGVAFTRDYRSVGSDREEENSVRFAYQFSVGYDFSRYRAPIFGELRYYGNAVDRLNGFAFLLGFRM